MSEQPRIHTQPVVEGGSHEDALLDILEHRQYDNLPGWEDVYNGKDKVRCDCPQPHVQRSGSQALGLVLDIDLCCLALEVERLTGKKFYQLRVTKPGFEWDCTELVEQPDGPSKPRGKPAAWMLERARQFGIKIKNL